MALEDQKETSLMFPQLHPYNLKQLASAVAYFCGRIGKDGKTPIPGVWFHGDGNMYTEKVMSDDRKVFHNDHPVNEGANYRALFTKTDAIPTTLAQMEKVLQGAKLKEDQDAALEATKKSSNDNAFPMLADNPPAPEAAPPPPPSPETAPVPPPPSADKPKKSQ